MHVVILYARPIAYIAEFLFGVIEEVRNHNARFIVGKRKDLTLVETEIECIITDGGERGFASPGADNTLPDPGDYRHRQAAAKVLLNNVLIYCWRSMQQALERWRFAFRA